MALTFAVGLPPIISPSTAVAGILSNPLALPVPSSGLAVPGGLRAGVAIGAVLAELGRRLINGSGARPRRAVLRSATRVAGRAAGSAVARAAAPAAQGAAPRRRKGILLMNIGTPASTETKDVREYLGRFLGDDRVLDIKPALLKAVLLQVLLAVRPQKSAAAYAKIWDAERGSPLLYHTQDLQEALQQELGDEFVVRIGFAYSQPFVEDALREFAAEAVDEVLLVPMFPHYASSTTGSLLQNVYETAAKQYCTPLLRVLPPFYDDKLYLQAMRSTMVEAFGERGCKVDHVLFSFHGIPERQCTATDDTQKHCLKVPDCCAAVISANRNCYRAQCFESARLLARELGLEDGRWSIGFQSRLTLRGTIQWIRPYTDEALAELPKRGVRRLGLLSPAFTADCIETIDELGDEGREEFEAAGGEELVLLPCLNSSSIWVAALAQMVRQEV